MKKLILLMVITILSLSCEGQKTSSKEIAQDIKVNNDQTTTYYFIRHAEKDLSNPSSHNPNLTSEGEERALEWRDFFTDKNINAIYSTNFTRTMRTAQPTADDHNLTVVNYNPSNLNSSDFQNQTKGKNVLVVGHSNTTAEFANSILERNEAPEIDDADYGNLYIVTIKNGESSFKSEYFN